MKYLVNERNICVEVLRVAIPYVEARRKQRISDNIQIERKRSIGIVCEPMQVLLIYFPKNQDMLPCYMIFFPPSLIHYFYVHKNIQFSHHFRFNLSPNYLLFLSSPSPTPLFWTNPFLHETAIFFILSRSFSIIKPFSFYNFKWMESWRSSK